MRTRDSKRLEIGVLYGFRALLVLFVVNYHFWQQSWLGQYVRCFGSEISFDFWTRSSYAFVDGMILLSGFLLYLPHARQKLEGTPVADARSFYIRRIARILPSYLAAVLAALFLVAIPQQVYPSADVMLHDVAAHLTFTFLFWPRTYLVTPLNVALWTIAVEMQFYLIFPLLAKCMRKKSALTAGTMMVCGWLYRGCVARFATNYSMLLNQLPAFLDVYALGFLGAVAYVKIRRDLRRRGRSWRMFMGLSCVALFVVCIPLLTELLKFQSSCSTISHEALQLSQMWIRLPLVLILLAMMLSASFWPHAVQKLLDNRLTRFLSAISLNLYIWHQILAVEMRKAWFPDIQLLHSDPKLQTAYTVLSYSVAILVAMAMTYGLEKPAAQWVLRLGERGRKKVPESI